MDGRIGPGASELGRVEGCESVLGAAAHVSEGGNLRADCHGVHRGEAALQNQNWMEGNQRR